MALHTVRRRGTDSSSRPIFASDYMWAWWERVCDELGFTPTIVQGAWMTMAGGGAGASAGYHDGGGCFDLRTWDRTSTEVSQIIRVTRRLGAASWVRDKVHGNMDPHLHFVLGSDFDIDDGAFWQWQRYLAGRDGLSSDGPDYHWRPDPIVTRPPEDEMNAAQEKKLDDLRDEVARIHKRLDNERERDAAERERDRKHLDKVLAKLEALHPDE